MFECDYESLASDRTDFSNKSSSLMQACCAHCGLAVNQGEQLMQHVKEEHHIAPLECRLCRKVRVLQVNARGTTVENLTESSETKS